MTMDEYLQQVLNLLLEEQDDVYSQNYMSFAWINQIDAYIAGGVVLYSKDEAYPKVFDGHVKVC